VAVVADAVSTQPFQRALIDDEDAFCVLTPDPSRSGEFVEGFRYGLTRAPEHIGDALVRPARGAFGFPAASVSK
jgi:hypothetical protein